MTFEEYLRTLRGKTVDVIGIGVSNRPLLRLLAQAGASVVAHDKKTAEQLGEIVSELRELGVRTVLGEDYLNCLEGEIVFRTPGLRPDHPALEAARARGAEVTSEMEVFFDLCPCAMIAVTGSDGKTTTTTVISEMLKAAGKTVWLGGNIGAPLLDQTGKMRPEDYAVLELSSFQLMSMKKTPHIAVITNLSPNHLDWHRDMAEYIDAKCHIFRQQGPEDVLVLNYDNAPSRALAEQARGEVRFFSRAGAEEARVRLENGVILYGTEPLFPASEIRIPGVHNVENYMTACAALHDIVSPEIMARVAREFAGVEHRLELVRELDGVRWYNDSIGSSPTRTLAGLNCFPEKVILIAGGYDKHVPFDGLGAAAPAHVKTLLLCGATADKIETAVKQAPDYREGSPAILHFTRLDDAVTAARELAKPGDVVLFSPACASFDQFPNFMIRGRYFKDRVNELK